MGVAVPDTFVSYALGPLMHVSGHWSAWGAMLSGGRASCIQNARWRLRPF